MEQLKLTKLNCTELSTFEQKETNGGISIPPLIALLIIMYLRENGIDIEAFTITF